MKPNGVAVDQAQSLPLWVRYPWWPWRPANEVRHRELGYWLARTERGFPAATVSEDLMRAIRVEIGAVVHHADPVTRRGDKIFAVIVSFILANLSAAIFFDAGVYDQLPRAATIGLYVASNLLAILFGWRATRWVTNHHALRAVLARERLDRWLPPLQLAIDPPHQGEREGGDDVR